MIFREKQIYFYKKIKLNATAHIIMLIFVPDLMEKYK